MRIEVPTDSPNDVSAFIFLIMKNLFLLGIFSLVLFSWEKNSELFDFEFPEYSAEEYDFKLEMSQQNHQNCYECTPRACSARKCCLRTDGANYTYHCDQKWRGGPENYIFEGFVSVVVGSVVSSAAGWLRAVKWAKRAWDWY